MGASMKNNSTICTRKLSVYSARFAIVAIFAFSAALLHSQCTADDDPDSLGCQIQKPAPAEQQDSPAVFPLGEIGRRVDSKPAGISQSENYSDGRSSVGSDASDRRRVAVPQGKGAAPLTEFQRFVAASTGQLLPIYGADLFATQPASFAPIDHVPAPVDMIIGPEDELRIRIWGQINFDASLRVSRNGEVYLPKVGPIHVAGLPFSAVAGHIHNALKSVFHNFELSVDVGEIHSIQVYVTGQARHPGEYTVSALSTLIDAVFASGGPSPAGSMRHIELKRARTTIADIDLYAFLVVGDKTGDVQLQSGDVLYIPPTGGEVALLGSVRRPGIYEVLGRETIEDLLNAAGGRTALASGARLAIERPVDHNRREVFELEADSTGLATELADGEIVRVDSMVPSYRGAVTLRGSVANPGRFRWHEGMRLSELMPDRDALVTRDYWWNRSQLGLPTPEFTPLVEALKPMPDVDRAQTTGTQGWGTEAAADDRANPLRLPETVTRNAAESTAPLDQRAIVLRPAAETDWNYAVIESTDLGTMTNSLIPFDPGRLVLQHDPSQDLALQPGDVITIFSQDDINLPIDQQTRYIRLEGEFVHPGVYSVSPPESLRSVVARAGGLTKKAYLYAALFTRKSTEVMERERINQYADQFEHQLSRDSIGSGSSLNGTAQQPAGRNPVEALNRALIDHLRQTKVTGRIVLNLQPEARGEDRIPDIPLEDGDRLLVPSAPATVQVIGSVANQNAFLFSSNATVADYMHLAGGPTQDADRGHAFVLRADGSVAKRGAKQYEFASGFDKLRLYPGDTIIVPEKRINIGAVRGILGWSQLISQLSLGAAAVDVIK